LLALARFLADLWILPSFWTDPCSSLMIAEVSFIEFFTDHKTPKKEADREYSTSTTCLNVMSCLDVPIIFYVLCILTYLSLTHPCANRRRLTSVPRCEAAACANELRCDRCETNLHELRPSITPFFDTTYEEDTKCCRNIRL
jgi:hypothetical protein